MLRLWFSLSTLSMLACQSIAGAADSIDDTLATARQNFEQRTSSARETFLSAIARRQEALAKKSDLEDIKRLKTEKDAFVQDGTIPTSPFVALERKQYETEIDRAKAALKKALETAKSEYVKAERLAEAEAIDSELRAGASPVAEKVTKLREPLDPIVGFWRIVVGERGQKQTIINVYFPPVDNLSVRSGMARRNQTSPVKYFQGSWSRSGDIYTLHGPNGSTAKVTMKGGGEGFVGRLAAGIPIVGFRQQR